MPFQSSYGKLDTKQPWDIPSITPSGTAVMYENMSNLSSLKIMIIHYLWTYGHKTVTAYEMSKNPQPLQLCILKLHLFTQVPSLPKHDYKLIIKNKITIIIKNWII